MRRAALLVIVLAGCAAPFRFRPPTPEAQARRRIASRLAFCLRAETVGMGARERASCYCAAEARCALAGLDDDCATTELFMGCITDVQLGPPGSLPSSASCIPPAAVACRAEDRSTKQL